MKQKTEQIQSSAIARFFSATVLKELALKGKSPTLARLIRESGMSVDPASDRDVGGFLDRAFHQLKSRDNRHEYIYKAAITKRILMGTYSLQTASMLTEFRVGPCKADAVILNGTATVYEIKSERDSLSRLSSQIAAYEKVFATVNVISGANHIDAVLESVPAHVGVFELSSKYNISRIREGENRPERTNSDAIFDVINIREAGEILQSLGIKLPDVPNTQRYAAYRGLFARLPSEIAHREMVSTLKKTRDLMPLKSLLSELPESLHSISISSRIRKKDHQRLIDAIQTPIYKLECWG